MAKECFSRDARLSWVGLNLEHAMAAAKKDLFAVVVVVVRREWLLQDLLCTPGRPE